MAAAEKEPGVFTLQVRLKDAFGDNGMISVIICRPTAPGVWTIDTWLMSCRVLGRKVEEMALREILTHARDAGVRTLVGVYRPTEKNALVREHYRKLGFAKVEEEADGATVWTMPTTAEIATVPMTVSRTGFRVVHA